MQDGNDLFDIKRILVEFNDNTRALLTTDDEHEWRISCVDKYQGGDAWADGVKAEIDGYVYTWVQMNHVLHERGLEEMYEFLQDQAAVVKEAMCQENN